MTQYILRLSRNSVWWLRFSGGSGAEVNVLRSVALEWVMGDGYGPTNEAGFARWRGVVVAESNVKSKNFSNPDRVQSFRNDFFRTSLTSCFVSGTVERSRREVCGWKKVSESRPNSVRVWKICRLFSVALDFFYKKEFFPVRFFHITKYWPVLGWP